MVQIRVLAVVAGRNGEQAAKQTLRAIEDQTRTPDAVVGVDVASSDNTATVLKSSIDTVVRLRSRVGFGQALQQGIAELPDPDEGDWLWFLAHDSAPAEDALERLTATVEANRRVAIVGPKVMRAHDPATINEFGETMTPFGASIRLAAGDLDQGQHDNRSDVMGVAVAGMLVRRDVFEALGGFDSALPSIDAGLDLGVRARLAGHQVTVQPDARVSRNGGPELFGAKSVSDAALTGIGRKAQLHRRFAYAPAWAVVVHWLLLLPQALVRSIGHLLAKRPAAIVSEFAAAFAAMFSFGAVAAARKRIRRTKRAQWSDLTPLRISWRAVRNRRRLAGDDEVVNTRVADERVGFVQGGTLWVFGIALLVGVLMTLPVLTSAVAAGGGLLPLGDFGQLWAGALWGDREATGGVVGPADSFQILVALLGSLTFWQPSLAIIITLLLAPALSSVTAWVLVRRVTRIAWVPAVAAAVWALAPTLLTSVHEGRFGAVVAHIALPLVAYGIIRAHSLMRAAALGAVCMAVVAAGAPSLLPALLVGVAVGILWFLLRARFGAAGRGAFMLIPVALLFVPLAIAQTRRGTPLAMLADPGIPLSYAAPDAAVLAAQLPDAPLGTLAALFSQFGLTGSEWPMIITLALTAPLTILAFTAPFMRSGPGIAGIALALAGFVTAVASSGIELTAYRGDSAAIWTGPGISLMLLGLMIAASVALGVLDFRGKVPGALVALCAVIAGGGTVAGAMLSPALVTPAPERTMPALVVAAAAEDPDLGTLVIEQADGALLVSLVRGSGTTYGDVQTYTTTASEPAEDRTELSQLAVDLVSGSSVDAQQHLQEQGIGFVVLREGAGNDLAQLDSMQRSLNQRGDLQEVGQTDAGLLWKTQVEAADIIDAAPPWNVWLLVAQLAAMAIALVLSLPAVKRGSRSRVSRARTSERGNA